MADEAQAFCFRWYRCERIFNLLVLVGPTGCGKSHTAKAIYAFAVSAAFTAFERIKGWNRNPPSVRFCHWPKTVDGFKDGSYGVLDDLLSADLLVLDDIGAEYDPSKSAANKLCQIFTRRENAFTVVTTNITPGKWPEVFDARIADRLLRNSKVIDLDGVMSYALIN